MHKPHYGVIILDTVVILAGGKSRRMGRDKLQLSLDGRTLLESVVNRFSDVFENVYLSVADADKYPDITVRRIVDIIPGAGPMSGLHAAFKSLPDDGVFLVAADLPFASPMAAKRIIELCGTNDACIVRQSDGRFEPLFGYYRKTLLPSCENALSSGNYKMTVLFDSADVRYVDPEELGELWDEKLVMNINYPEDFEKIRG